MGQNSSKQIEIRSVLKNFKNYNIESYLNNTVIEDNKELYECFSEAIEQPDRPMNTQLIDLLNLLEAIVQHNDILENKSQIYVNILILMKNTIKAFMETKNGLIQFTNQLLTYEAEVYNNESQKEEEIDGNEYQEEHQEVQQGEQEMLETKIRKKRGKKSKNIDYAGTDSSDNIEGNLSTMEISTQPGSGDLESLEVIEYPEKLDQGEGLTGCDGNIVQEPEISKKKLPEDKPNQPENEPEEQGQEEQHEDDYQEQFDNPIFEIDIENLRKYNCQILNLLDGLCVLMDYELNKTSPSEPFLKSNQLAKEIGINLSRVFNEDNTQETRMIGNIPIKYYLLEIFNYLALYGKTLSEYLHNNKLNPIKLYFLNENGQSYNKIIWMFIYFTAFMPSQKQTSRISNFLLLLK